MVILDLKNTTSKMKMLLNRHNRRVQRSRERFSELGHQSIEINQFEEQRENRIKRKQVKKPQRPDQKLSNRCSECN